jgi:hypothetical protein
VQRATVVLLLWGNPNGFPFLVLGIFTQFQKISIHNLWIQNIVVCLHHQTKTITMDLRELTIERLEELIAINTRKMNQPHNQNIIGKLTAVRITLERALEWKQQNA